MGIVDFVFAAVISIFNFCWFLFKLAVCYVILAGCLSSLGVEFSHITTNKVVYGKWYVLLLLVFFIWFIQLRKKISSLEDHIVVIKLANVTLLNYLQIEPITDAQVNMKEKSLTRNAIDSVVENLVYKLMGVGELADGTLTAKATRRGAEVNLFEDLRGMKDNSEEY